MYKEIYKPQKLGILYIVGTVTMAFCLLSVPSWINWTMFAWMYQIAVLILCAFAVSKLIRRNCAEYIYAINEGLMTVTIKTGIKEQIVCAFDLTDIREMTENKTKKQLEQQYGSMKYLKCTGDIIGVAGKQIVYSDETGVSVLIYHPTEKFTENLQTEWKDRLDKSAGM